MDKSSPQVQGAVITFTATASGGSGNYEYYYTFRNPNTGIWTVGQAYSGNAVWQWDTGGLGPGTYTIQVWARSSGSTAPYEAYKSITYTINLPAPPPATGVTLSMDKSSPQVQGAVITFTASASGGSGTYEYQYWLRSPNMQWSTPQAYSGNAAWQWNTAGLGSGAYLIEVGARSAGSTASYEAVTSVFYTINPPPVTGVTVSTDKASPQVQGVVITFTAVATGGSGTYEYYFTLWNPNTGTWSVGRAYSGNAVWQWGTGGLGPGTYTIQVWARSARSTAVYEAWTVVSYMINPL
jgi:hypothetical protein